MTEPMHLLSLGAGVQSSTAALMAACGELTPMPYAAVFADTTKEPKSVYDWLDWLEQQLPFPVYRVSAGDLGEDSTKIRISKKTGQTYCRTLIPAFVAKPNGGRSLLGRKCTAEYKVREIVKKARELVGKDSMKLFRATFKGDLKAISLAEKNEEQIPLDEWRRCQEGAIVHTWIGISLDEIGRVKESRDPWTKSVFPLLRKRMTRDNCNEWMMARFGKVPPKSACKWCPFHDDEYWLWQKNNEPLEFAESVQFEKDLNYSNSQATGTAKLAGPVFLHESLIPLDEIDFESRLRQPESRQRTLAFADECEGLCGQ